jgi:hypothetical protein
MRKVVYAPGTPDARPVYLSATLSAFTMNTVGEVLSRTSTSIKRVAASKHGFDSEYFVVPQRNTL